MKLDFSDPNPEVTDAYFNGVEAGHSARDDEIEELAGQVYELEKELRLHSASNTARIERVAALEAEAAVLRGALAECIDSFEYASSYKSEYLQEKHGDREEIKTYRAALATPSPAAEAVRGVLDAAVKIRGLNVEVCDCERCIKNEGYSEKFWNTMSELEFRIDAYTALRDGRVDGGWNDSETKVQVS